MSICSGKPVTRALVWLQISGCVALSRDGEMGGVSYEEDDGCLPLASSSTPATASTPTCLSTSSSSSTALRPSDTVHIPLAQFQCTTTESSHTRVSNPSFPLIATSKTTSSPIRPLSLNSFKHNTILLGLPPPLKLPILLFLLNTHPLMFRHVFLCEDRSLGAEFEQTQISSFMAVFA
jgi:hypothetical protein